MVRLLVHRAASRLSVLRSATYQTEDAESLSLVTMATAGLTATATAPATNVQAGRWGAAACGKTNNADSITPPETLLDKGASYTPSRPAGRRVFVVAGTRPFV